MYQVSLVPCSTYDPERLQSALQETVAPWGGLEGVLAGERILLKLNLLTAKPPEAAVTTHPSVLRAMIDFLQANGRDVVVGDSPGGIHTPRSFQRLLEITGIAPVIRDTGCEVVFFDDQVLEYRSTVARTYSRFPIPRILTEVDNVIGLPRLKTHQLTVLTGAVKLLYGYIPGTRKAEYHLHTGKNVNMFAELLCDLYATFPPTFTLMDGIVAMEGNGPHHGSPRPLGFLLAGTSAPAVDFMAAWMTGFDPLQIPTIRIAADRDLGPRELSEIQTFGPDPAGLRVLDFCPPDAHRLFSLPEFFVAGAQRFLAVRPTVNRHRCKRCGFCEHHCPARAVTCDVNGFPVISSSRCIRCFCCQELCPAGAILVHRPLVRRLLPFR
jgi:uncharacterized protein (DUF362 family)/Pyruvate/2-oxoacid:ferredoxin oxidoreductase delta subunit